MIQVNPDLTDVGSPYIPEKAVIAFFPAHVDIETVLGALSDAGLTPQRIDVFVGAEGKKALDADGKKHSSNILVRFVRTIQGIFSDEKRILKEGERILSEGGSFIAVFTEDDKDIRFKAGEVLKAQAGQLVQYWGPWHQEYL
jgi:hypothetical protein